MKPSFSRAVLLGALSVLLPATARASCGAASCPLDVRAGDWTEKGVVRLDYGEEYINQNEPKIGNRQATVGQIRGHHDEIYTLSETRRFGFDIGLASRWSVQMILPFVHREHQHIQHGPSGDKLETWNFDGVGDLTVLNRVAVRRPPNRRGTTLGVIVGGVLPTGRDQVSNTEGEHAEDGILPGKNALSLILGGSAARPFSAKTLAGTWAEMPAFVSSTYQWNGKNPRDNYRIGNVWLVNAGLAYPLLPKLALSQQLNLRVNRKDDAGSTDEEIEKTGGTFLYYSPGLQLTLIDNLWSYVYVQVPVVQRVNSIQVTSDYNLMIGAAYRFSAL